MFRTKVYVVSILFVLLFSQTHPSHAAAEPLQEARELINDYYVEEVPSWLLAKPTIKEMVRYLDKYSAYMTAEEFNEFVKAINQQLVGIGITIEEDGAGIEILATSSGGPAEKAGLLPGDIITHVDGISMKDQSTQYAISMITGQEGTTVQLTYLRGATGEAITVGITRTVIQLTSVEYKMLGGNIGYIRLYSFSENAAAEINYAMERLPNAKGWILDLRDNGGGYVSAAQEVAGFFPAVKYAFQLRYKGNETEIYQSIQQKNTFKTRTHLLINNYSASASEMVAASVKEQKGAVLYGQKTYGKGSMQSLFALSDHSVLKLTTAHFYSPSGISVHEVGVTPDIQTLYGSELISSHKDQLKAQYRLYRKLTPLTQASGTKSFQLKSSTQMDWTGISSKDVQLIQLGGKEVPLDLTVMGERILKVTPKEQLLSQSSYILLIHPNWKAKNGRNMLFGSWVEIAVQ